MAMLLGGRLKWDHDLEAINRTDKPATRGFGGV